LAGERRYDTIADPVTATLRSILSDRITRRIGVTICIASAVCYADRAARRANAATDPFHSDTRERRFSAHQSRWDTAADRNTDTAAKPERNADTPATAKRHRASDRRPALW
jgi:hypothetical protein